jgi:hypothetical protein
MLLTDILLERYIDVREALAKYKNDDDIYVSYTDDVGSTMQGRHVSGAKLGINPKSPYNTPIGIYTYPLTLIWSEVLTGSLPFGGKRPFIQVVKPKGTVVRLSSLSDAEFSRYCDLLKGYYLRTVPGADDDTWESVIEDTAAGSLNNSNGGRLWALTRHLAVRTTNRKAPVTWNAIWRWIGVVGCRDDGDGIIHRNEPVQACFFSARDLMLIETVRNEIKRSWISPDIKITVRVAQDLALQFYDDEGDGGYAHRFAVSLGGQLRELLVNGVSDNFVLQDRNEFYKNSEVPDLQNIVNYLIHHGMKATDVLGVMDLPGSPFAIPEIADVLVNALAYQKAGRNTLRLWNSEAIRVLSKSRGQGEDQTRHWLAGRVVLAILMGHSPDPTNTPPGDEAVAAGFAVLRKAAGLTAAKDLTKTLGKSEFTRVCQDALKDDIPF